jgi:hypothetical protein
MQDRKSRPVGLIGIPHSIDCHPERARFLRNERSRSAYLFNCHPEATALSSLKDLGEPRGVSRLLRHINSAFGSLPCPHVSSRMNVHTLYDATYGPIRTRAIRPQLPPQRTEQTQQLPENYVDRRAVIISNAAHRTGRQIMFRK